MPDTLEIQLLALNRPGIVIEVDARTAEDLGAFEEEALSEEDALASADTEDREGAHFSARRGQEPEMKMEPILTDERAERSRARRAAGSAMKSTSNFSACASPTVRYVRSSPS